MERSDAGEARATADDSLPPVSTKEEAKPQRVKSDYDGYASAYWSVTVSSAALISGVLGVVVLLGA